MQATTTEVANGSTVSLNDPSIGTTVVTTLTQPDGSFSLNIKNAAIQSDRPYLLEALKGLSAGGVAKRAGAPGARIRMLVSLSSSSWTSLTGTSVRINPSTTALCIVSGFRALNLPQQQALEYQRLWDLVYRALEQNNDPIETFVLRPNATASLATDLAAGYGLRDGFGWVTSGLAVSDVSPRPQRWAAP